MKIQWLGHSSFRILGSYATGPQLDRIGLDDVEDSHA